MPMDAHLIQSTLISKMFEPRQVAMAKRIQELDIQIQTAQEELAATQQKVYANAQGEKHAAKITVTVLAEQGGLAEITLTYGTSKTTSDL